MKRHKGADYAEKSQGVSARRQQALHSAPLLAAPQGLALWTETFVVEISRSLERAFGMNTASAEIATRKHMQRVSELMGEAACELIKRAAKHDLSKLTAIELEPLQRMQDIIDAEGQAPYGSDEYKRRTKMLGPMLANHYANNSHHPEHYARGVDDMDLFDVIEMFLDWKAASERGEESSMNINKACERFEVSDQLRLVMMNTASRLGYAAQ